MALSKKFTIWWGPPKKFSTDKSERRITWLELFYDLVYVIAIARLVHQLAHHISFGGFVEFVCLFTLVYWGWLNGSLHHDLHGNQGLRTRLMMLWQMLIIAALSVTLGKPSAGYGQITVIFILMQLFITYQWWSVGFYDKEHRRYSKPYIALFLVAAGLMVLSLFVPKFWLAIIFPVILICNYAPPFLTHRLLVKSDKRLDLSSSMFERLGLFTIIIFGELVIGVVNGVSEMVSLGWIDWANFALAIVIVFSLWWIFFVFVSTREVQKGFAKASLLELLYIPALASLCLVASCFPSFFGADAGVPLQGMFGYAIAAFLFCIILIMELLVYPPVFDHIKRPIRLAFFLAVAVFVVFSAMRIPLSLTVYLLAVESILLLAIALLNYIYYDRLLKEGIDPSEV